MEILKHYEAVGDAISLKSTHKRHFGIVNKPVVTDGRNTFVSDFGDILNKQIGKVNERLKENELELRPAEGLLDVLADRGFDPEFGARPLKRLIQKMLLDPLATKLLEGDIAAGSVIEADWNDGEAVFTVA